MSFKKRKISKKFKKESSEAKLRKFSFSFKKHIPTWKKHMRICWEFLKNVTKWRKQKELENEAKTGKWKKWLKRIFYFTFGTGVIGIFAVFIILYIAFSDDTLPDITDPKKIVFSEATILYDSTGETPLYTVYGDENRTYVEIDDISQNMVNAILSAEDDQFFEHEGYDIPAIFKAVCYISFDKLQLSSIGGGICPPRGGSTITQQLAKNMFLTRDRSIKRKLQELVLSVRMEDYYSKNKILEMYLNKIHLGGTIYGVEKASKAYFGKSAKDLTPAEAVILASLPKYPSLYYPYGERSHSRVVLSDQEIQKNNYQTFEDIHELEGNTWEIGLIGQDIELANGKSDFFFGRSDGYVLPRMKELGFLTEEEYKKAKEELLNIEFHEYKERIKAPHFVFWAQKELKKELQERLGISEEEAELIGGGGLTVITTIDLELQKIAEEKILEQAETNLSKHNIKNASLLAIEPDTGYVRVMVGSVDYWSKDIDGKVNMTATKRHPGSTFKPIAYAAAFEQGKLSPATVLFDAKTNFGGYIPQSYDGKYRGPVSIRESLGNSLNVPAVKASIIADYNNVYDLAKRLGIDFDEDADYYGNQIALGGADATSLQMASVFSVFANGGKKVTPIGILRVEDRNGNILFSNEKKSEEAPEQILDPVVSYLVTNMLADSESRGPGWNSTLQLFYGRENIAKTGTATLLRNDNNKTWPSDAWVIGGTPQLIAAAWAGNNKPQEDYLKSGAGGMKNAGPFWRGFLIEALKETEKVSFTKPKSGLSLTQVSKLSGKLPIPGAPESLVTTEIFDDRFLPEEEDASVIKIEIDSISGKLKTDLTPEKAIEEKLVLQMKSFYPESSAWQDPITEWMLDEENRALLIEKYELEGTDLLLEMPTEYDDAHTAETELRKPDFKFISPQDGDVVAPPRITIELDIDAPNRFKKVLFLWDDQIVKAFTDDGPYIIKASKNSKDPEEVHRLKAVVTDDLLYTIEKEIELTFGEDDDSPELTITYPNDGDRISGGNTTIFTADASDETGAVQRVEFYIENESIGSDFTPPYEINWETPNVSENFELTAKAIDTAGNSTRKTVEFTLKKQDLPEVYGILSPQDGDKFLCSQNISIRSAVVGETYEDFEKIEIRAEDQDKKKVTIGAFEDRTKTGIFEINFIPDTCGEWRFYTKTTLTNQKIRISPKVSIVFEE